MVQFRETGSVIRKASGPFLRTCRSSVEDGPCAGGARVAGPAGRFWEGRRLGDGPRQERRAGLVHRQARVVLGYDVPTLRAVEGPSREAWSPPALPVPQHCTNTPRTPSGEVLLAGEMSRAYLMEAKDLGCLRRIPALRCTTVKDAVLLAVRAPANASGAQCAVRRHGVADAALIDGTAELVTSLTTCTRVVDADVRPVVLLMTAVAELPGSAIVLGKVVVLVREASALIREVVVAVREAGENVVSLLRPHRDGRGRHRRGARDLRGADRDGIRTREDHRDRAARGTGAAVAVGGGGLRRGGGRLRRVLARFVVCIVIAVVGLATVSSVVSSARGGRGQVPDTRSGAPACWTGAPLRVQCSATARGSAAAAARDASAS